ncbi:MAG TPA: PfkB family carbohydrate kinase [Patescibacteria group bacterium]|nr:PfkB family carbohydrate kinase [Patescibacteria group bacterium]
MRKSKRLRILLCGFCTEDRVGNNSYFGGAAGAMALNMSGLGVRCGLLSILGNDRMSSRYLTELKKRGVNLSLVYRVSHRIPLLTVTNGENREASRTFDDFGTLHDLADLKPDNAIFNNYDILHIVNTPEHLADYVARHFRGTVSYCPGSLFIRDKHELSAHLLKKARYVFCNEEEYDTLIQSTPIARLFKKNLTYVFKTQGDRGVIVFSPTTTRHFSPIKSKTVIDTTGAGDAFALGVLEGISKSESLERSIQKGLHYAASCVGKEGVVFTEGPRLL